MPNLIITNACNLSCPFCFASEYRVSEPSRVSQMSVEELQTQIGFAGVDTVRFCGGEPTLHPDFVEMLTITLDPPGRRAFVMTNGLWP
ncbi:radical SAM protein, partial [Myxococcota bacterium]